MDLPPNRFANSLWFRLKAWGPAVSFFGGFGWDALTMGRSIQPFDLFTLLAYWLGAGALLFWLARKPEGPPHAPNSPGETLELNSDAKGAALKRWWRKQGPYFLLQFLFGNLFSGLVIFYFKSAGDLGAFILVAVLGTLLVWNEFLEHHYHRFTLTWTLFGVCGMLFLNFAMPHLFKSVHPFWFFASTVSAVAATWGLRRASPKARGKIWPTFAAGTLLIALFLLKAIPPVPLVLKGLAVGRKLEKGPAGYSVQIEPPPFWAPFRRSEKTLHHHGEPVYCVSSVFLPAGIDLRLVHNWRHWDAHRNEWQTFTRAGFSLRGGRQQGFRGYTFKQSLPPGRWQVGVETEDGRELGSTSFEVLEVDSLPTHAWRTVVLP